MKNKKIQNYFNKNKYVLINNAISEDMADFLYKYLLLRRQVARTMFDKKFISPFETMFGHWNDQQVMNTYAIYSDNAMETLLVKMLPVMREITNLKLEPNYSFSRVYKTGDILARHKDRPSCEISTTLNLGGDPWPIYIDKTGKDTVIDEYKNIIKPNAPKGTEVLLNPGDMLVYKGCDLEHWREPFQGEVCGQVFLHYSDSKKNKKIFDDRLHLGLPSQFKDM